jgi:putative ABC transport system permease protein
MEEVVAESTARVEFNTMLLTIFAGSLYCLPRWAWYGLTAYSVAQRTREIGIRSAIGTKPGDIRGMVLAEGSRLTGVGFGVAAALVLTLWMESLIGVKTWDPAVFGRFSLWLCQCWVARHWWQHIPARRATRVDPVRAPRRG